MEWDAPAPTITTQCFGYGNGRFGHPEQNRAITLREASILRTFPESDRFLGERQKIVYHPAGGGQEPDPGQPVPLGYSILPLALHDGERVCFSVSGRLIDNAVPVRLGEVVAESLLTHVARHG